MRTVYPEFGQLDSRSGRGSATEPVSLEFISGDGTRRPITGAVHVFKAESLIISSRDRIFPSAVVAAQYNDVLLIGEVLSCNSELDSSWIIRIKVRHMLTGLQSLIRLRSALFGETGLVDLNPEPERTTSRGENIHRSPTI